MVKTRELFRALFLVVKTLAAQYGVTMPVGDVKHATDETLKRVYKRLVLKVHLGKGYTVCGPRTRLLPYARWQNHS